MIIKHKPITSQEQYMKVAYRREQLKNAAPATLQEVEYKLMTSLIAEYEANKQKPRASFA